MHGQWKRFYALLLRDLAVVTATLWSWSVYLGRLPSSDAMTITLAILAALMTFLVGYLVHEWGHLIGAWVSHSVFQMPARVFETFFLFRFDRDRNSRPQFFTMALGGFAASILMVGLLVAALPHGVLATWIALALTAFGVVATFVTEVPEFLRVWRGGPIPSGAAFIKQASPAPLP